MKAKKPTAVELGKFLFKLNLELFNYSQLSDKVIRRFNEQIKAYHWCVRQDGMICSVNPGNLPTRTFVIELDDEGTYASMERLETVSHLIDCAADSDWSLLVYDQKDSRDEDRIVGLNNSFCFLRLNDCWCDMEEANLALAEEIKKEESE